MSRSEFRNGHHAVSCVDSAFPISRLDLNSYLTTCVPRCLQVRERSMSCLPGSLLEHMLEAEMEQVKKEISRKEVKMQGMRCIYQCSC